MASRSPNACRWQGGTDRHNAAYLDTKARQIGASAVTPADPDMVLNPCGDGPAFPGRLLPCTIGRGGVTTTSAKATGPRPPGCIGLIGCLYRPDRMARPCGLGGADRAGQDLWSDDPRIPRITT
jgi:hypothetical protein